jgi:hypothetical protein
MNDAEFIIKLEKSHSSNNIIWLDFEYIDKKIFNFDPLNSIRFQKINNEFVSTSAIYNSSLVNYLINNNIVSVSNDKVKYKNYSLKLTSSALLTLL